ARRFVDQLVAIADIFLDVDDDRAEHAIELVRELLRIEELAALGRLRRVGPVGIDRAVLSLRHAGEEAVDDLRHARLDVRRERVDRPLPRALGWRRRLLALLLVL